VEREYLYVYLACYLFCIFYVLSQKVILIINRNKEGNMIPNLKLVVVSVLLVPFVLASTTPAIAGGLEGSGDVAKQISALKDQINQLSSTVGDLKKDNLSSQARTKELESELATIKGLTPGSEIAASMETRVNSLEDKVGAIKISGAITGIVQSSVNHKINSSTQANNINFTPNRFGQTTNDQAIGAGSFDLYLEAKILDNTRIYANLEANSTNQVFGSLFAPNGNITVSTNTAATGTDVLNLLEVYAESEFYDGRLVTTVGKIDLTNYFDGNNVAWDEHRQFLAGAFLDNPTFTAVLPFNTIGARASYDIGWGLTAQIAAVSADNAGTKLFNDAFGILEIDYNTQIFGREGNYRVYGYVRQAADVSSASLIAAGESDAIGFGFSFDQTITDKFTVFSRFGFNSSKLAILGGVENSVTVGGEYVGLLPNRPNDVFGAAWGTIKPTDGPFVSPETPDNEVFMEFYYNYEVANNFHISPVLQFIKHPLGDDDENWSSIFGGRALLEF